MKITVESTEQMVEIVPPGEPAPGGSWARVPARVWIGRTESGIAVQCLITRIAVHKADDATEFERELVEQKHVPPPEPRAFSLRMIL